jgi:DNA-binding SARP family transcriptional activator/tetratricopeptide (TPR) repeat protein
MTCLHLKVLGGWSAHAGQGCSLALASRKARALLAFLALSPGQSQPRAKLMALLWGDSADRQAAQSLRRALYQVRRALGAAGSDALDVEGDRVTMRAGAVEVDARTFARLAGEDDAASLERAVALYRGELLEGLEAEAPAFEDWLRGERQRLFELAVESAGKLLGHELRAGHGEAAVRTAVHLVGLDPAQETIHRTLMRLYAEQGRRAAALRQYQLCVDALRRELGTEPEAETTELYLDVLRGDAGTPPATGPALPPASATGEAPLVGRETEVRALLQALDAARAGRGRLVVISGEAGIGKTRLVGELRQAAHVLECRLVGGRCHRTEQVLPFRPLIEALREAGFPGDGELVAGLTRTVRADLARLFPELEADESGVGQGPAALTFLFEALLELLRGAARRQPLALTLEDVHWADEMTLRWLAFAARHLGSSRAVIAVTMRDEELEDAPELQAALRELEPEPAVLRLALGGLSRPETRELMLALGRARGRGEPLEDDAARLWRASEGNPLVIVEAVREMLERGPRGGGDDKGIPRRVRELIEARFTRLDEPVRHVMAVAAVAGEPVGFGLLARSAGMEEREAALAVEQLVRRRLLHAVGERLEFSHDRIRETAYEALLPARRRALHRVVGEAMEGLPGEFPDGAEDRLAHHFWQAGVADRAVAHLVRFAETARHRNALDEATRSLERALELVDQLPAAAQERTQLDLLLRKGFVLALGSRYQEGFALLAPHRERVEALADPALAGPYFFRLGMCHVMRGDRREAEELGWRTIEEGERAGHAVTIGQGHYLLALRAHVCGHSFREAVDHARQAVAFLEGSGETHYRGMAHWVLAVHLLHLGRFGPALEALARVGAIAETLHEPRLVSFGAVVGLVRASLGEWQEAVRHCERALACSTDAVSRAIALSALGYSCIQGGDAPRAIAALEEGLVEARRLALRSTEARYAGYLSDAHLLAGHVDRAREAAEQAREVSQAIGHLWAEAWAERALGRAAHAAGDAPGAEKHLRTALSGFDAVDGRFEVGRTWWHLAEVLLALGRRVEAAAALGAARVRFAELHAPIWEARAAELAARLEGP